MTRRDLFKTLPALGAAYAQTPQPNLIRPKAPRSGDTVGLITPSTYVSDPDRLALAERMVRYFGLKPKWGKNVRKRAGYLGGSVAERVDDLHAMFADREGAGIFCIRGGYRPSPPAEANQVCPSPPQPQKITPLHRTPPADPRPITKTRRVCAPRSAAP